MTTDYDVICVGGGLGGSALAKAMAERGHRVLVVEREERFKDRVRGEYLMPWGVAESKALGVYDLLIETCGHHPQYQDVRVAGGKLPDRDFTETTPQGVHAMCFYHPQMQEALLAAAESAGAEVRRGVKVRGLETGREPAVTIEANGGSATVSARLVVGADGRGSMVRKWGGFEVLADDKGLQLAGLLLDGVNGVDDRGIMVLDPFKQRAALLFPQGDGKARAYFGNRVDEGMRLQGEKDVPTFFEESIKLGMPTETLETAEAAGPLATFPCIYEWVELPYRDGVALVGDAATTSDQTWGQGLSLTMGAVRRLRDALVENDDWDKAGLTFAEGVREMWTQIRTVELWFTELFYGTSPEANEARMRALPLIGQDPTRIHDAFASGLEAGPADEAARKRMFGEE